MKESFFKNRIRHGMIRGLLSVYFDQFRLVDGIKQKIPTICMIGILIKAASTYSPTLKRAVPSALTGLTSLFGMGRGGPRCYRHLKL